MVLPSSQTGRQDGGHHESSTVARRCGPSGQTCRTNNAVSHANARRKSQADRAHRQYPRGFESCQGSCGAVTSDGSMEDVLGLRGGKNHPPAAVLAPARSACHGRVTAGFRIIQPNHDRYLSRPGVSQLPRRPHDKERDTLGYDCWNPAIQRGFHSRTGGHCLPVCTKASTHTVSRSISYTSR